MDPKEEFLKILQDIYSKYPERIELITSLIGDTWENLRLEAIRDDSMEKTVAGGALPAFRAHTSQYPVLFVQIKDVALGELELRPGNYCIGRHAVNHIHLYARDPLASRVHALLVVSPDYRMTIYDLASSNGTFVGGKLVPPEGRQVHFREKIKIGLYSIFIIQKS